MSGSTGWQPVVAGSPAGNIFWTRNFRWHEVPDLGKLPRSTGWQPVLPRSASRNLGHDENFIGPGILNFCPGRITAYVNISAAGIKGAEHISWLVGHRFGSGKCSGRRWRRRRRLWLGLCSFGFNLRSFFGRALSLGDMGFWPVRRRRGNLRR